MQKRQQVGLLWISTGKYKQFVPRLLAAVEKYFLLNHDISIFLFTDEAIDLECNRAEVYQISIPSYRFPNASMLRYHVFNKHRKFLQSMDYLYYTDVDMDIVSEIDESILDNIVAVRHPGFHANSGGSWETRIESACYVAPEKRIAYYAGGVQGGSVNHYLSAISVLSSMINTDLENGITPIWHDESAWNKYLTIIKPYTILDPSFCMVEQDTLRRSWGIDLLQPKIIALAKNHEEIRS